MASELRRSRGGAFRTPIAAYDTVGMTQAWDAWVREKGLQSLDWGLYQSLGRTQAANGKGLLHLSGFLTKVVLPWCPQAEVHHSFAKQLVQMALGHCPALNPGPFCNELWAGHEASKMLTVLAHLRRVQDPVKAAQAMGKMNMEEKAQFMDLLSCMGSKLDCEKTGESTASYTAERSLKRHISEDSDGFPAMLKKREISKGALGQKDLCERRSLLHAALLDPGLSSAFAPVQGASSCRASRVAEGPKATGESATESGHAKGSSAKAKAKGPGRATSQLGADWKFSALRLVTATRPPRTYMQGLVVGSKGCTWKLVVEVTAQRCSQHREVMERILKEVQTKNLTKLHAQQLRDKLAPKH